MRTIKKIKNACSCQKRKGYLFNKMGPQLLTIYIKKTRNIYYNYIGGSEGSNKTSKFLANKIAHK